MSKSSQLPPITRAFLRTKTGRKRKAIVMKFHHWMTKQQLSLKALKPADVVSFCRHRTTAARRVKPSTWYHRRCRLLVYLHWLKAEDALSFNPRCLWAAKVL